jgi:hypothetical protein
VGEELDRARVRAAALGQADERRPALVVPLGVDPEFAEVPREVTASSPGRDGVPVRSRSDRRP